MARSYLYMLWMGFARVSTRIQSRCGIEVLKFFKASFKVLSDLGFSICS